MANIAIFRINYKSDFILTLNSDAGWLTPFCIKFWTGAPSQAYFAGYDGETYTHCAPVEGEPTKLVVQFDDHHLPIGDLKFQIGYHFTVADFPTSVEDEVLNQASVIIEVNDAPAQVMLDLNGETAPEIEFSLPAYANEAQRIANEEERIEAEQQRIANEDARIAAEETRQQNEQQRINQETARVNEFATLKSQSQAATRNANDAATLANQKAQLAADKAALADDAATLAIQKAQLAAEKAALANDAAQLAADKAALAQQKAEYAQQQGSYAKDQGDYAKDQGDYAKAQGDIAQSDHERAENDHGIAADDHTQAGNDHTRAEADHGIAADDHTQAGNDHTRAESDHGIAVDDHTLAGNDHTRAEADHGIAADDHTQAGNDHTRAESDHTRAESDHAAVEVYVDSLGAFDISAYHATGGVLAKYADLTAALGTNGANIPEALRKGGMSVKFVQGTAQSSDNKYVQFRLMADTFSATESDWQNQDMDKKQNILPRINEEQYSGSDNNIIFTDDSDNIVGEIDENGADFKNLKSNGKTVLTEKLPISEESASDIDDEIVITDDSDNEVGTINANGADFKNLKSNGKNVLTEDLPISDELASDLGDEIVITDDSDNVVGTVNENGADFKNLKSNGEAVLTESDLPLKYNYFRKVLLFSTTSLSELTNTSWVQNSGGSIICTGIGTSNKLTLSKDFFSDYREFKILMNLGSDNKFIFLFTGQSASYGHDVGKSQMMIDLANNKIGAYEITGINKQVVSSTVTEKNISGIITHTKVWVTFRRICCSYFFSIRDFYTGEEVALSFDNIHWEYGNMNGYLDMYLERGSQMPSIEKIGVYSGEAPDIVFAGDSITECSAMRDNVMGGLPYLFKSNNLKTKVMTWARGGCTINSLLLQWDLEMAVIKPKLIVLNIGANGGNSAAQFTNFKNKCDAIGAKLIICYTVCFTMENRDYRPINQEIKEYCDSNDIPFVRLDIATALNNVDTIDNNQQPNSALFLSDEVHPNLDGNTEMYKRLKVDADYLFNI